MREVTQVTLDDWEASRGNRVEGAQTRYFTLANVNYSIDLTDDSFAKFQEALAPFLEVATRITRKTPQERPGGPRKAARNAETQLIREWARTHGYPVNDRGRIAESIRDAYFQSASKPESE